MLLFLWLYNSVCPAQNTLCWRSPGQWCFADPWCTMCRSRGSCTAAMGWLPHADRWREDPGGTRGTDNNLLQIEPTMLTSPNNLEGLLAEIYGDLEDRYSDPEYLTGRAILAPKWRVSITLLFPGSPARSVFTFHINLDQYEGCLVAIGRIIWQQKPNLGAWVGLRLCCSFK